MYITHVGKPLNWIALKLNAILQAIFSNHFLLRKLLYFDYFSKIVSKRPLNNKPTFVRIGDYRRRGDKPLSEPIMVQLTVTYMRHSASFIFVSAHFSCCSGNSVSHLTEITSWQHVCKQRESVFTRVCLGYPLGSTQVLDTLNYPVNKG